MKARWMSCSILVVALAAPGAALADGKATYDKQCASCHAADGHGNAAKVAMLKVEPALLDLGRAEARSLPRDEKHKILVDGKGKMPAYGKKLAAADIDPVLDYALGLVGGGAAATPKPAPAPTPPVATSPPPAAPPAADAATVALWKKSCQSCHGADGAGVAARAKKLKIDASLLNLRRPEAAALDTAALRAIVAKGKGKMPAFEKKLGAAKVDKLTAHAEKLRR